jgi:hypothetical protein
MAYDAATGKKVWEVAHGRRFGNDRGDGPRATPTVDGDRLYVFGASGDLAAVDAATGKVHWKINVLETFGGSNIRWGLSESPLVLSDRVLVSPGGRGASIVALKKTDGSLIWKSLDDESGYSSAVLYEAGGIRQAIYFTGQRAVGVDVATGKLLWSYDQVANRTANIATPIVRGNRVFLSSAYNTGAALLELMPSADRVTARQVYFTHDMRNHHASSILIGDHLYGFSDAILTAMKFDTGEVAWRDRSVARALSSLRTTGSTSTASRGWSAWPKPIRQGTASTAGSGFRPATCRRGAIRSCRTASSSFGIRTPSTPTRSAANSFLIPRPASRLLLEGSKISGFLPHGGAGTGEQEAEIRSIIGSACLSRDRASLRAPQRERVRASSRRGARTRDAAGAGGGAPAPCKWLDPASSKERRPTGPGRD